MKVKFYLKDQKAEGESVILMYCRWSAHGQKYTLKYSTKETIMVDSWNKRQPHVGRADRGYTEKNARLSNYKNKAEDLFRRFANDHNNTPPTPEDFRTLLDKHFDRVLKPKPLPIAPPLTFFGWIEKYIADCKSGERLIPKTNKRFSESSIKGYNTTLKNLKEFEAKIKTKITFESVDMELYRKLLKYLNDKNFATNHVGSIVKYLKVFLNNALKDGVHQNRKFENSAFSKPSEEVDKIYLTDSELQTIYDLDLSGKKDGVERVRDLFLVGSYTGLRFSDYSKLIPENFLADGRLLRVKTQKTDTGVFIPLNPIVLAIVNKYNGKLPKSITNQQTNIHLKEIGFLADLTERIEITQTKGGMKLTTFKDKWELVTTHTARRSFATNAYLNGVATIDIMKITGHKTESSFMKYIKIDGEQTAMRLLDHPHFNQMSVSKFA